MGSYVDVREVGDKGIAGGGGFVGYECWGHTEGLVRNLRARFRNQL